MFFCPSATIDARPFLHAEAAFKRRGRPVPQRNPHGAARPPHYRGVHHPAPAGHAADALRHELDAEAARAEAPEDRVSVRGDRIAIQCGARPPGRHARAPGRQREDQRRRSVPVRRDERGQRRRRPREGGNPLPFAGADDGRVSPEGEGERSRPQNGARVGHQCGCPHRDRGRREGGRRVGGDPGLRGAGGGRCLPGGSRRFVLRPGPDERGAARNAAPGAGGPAPNSTWRRRGRWPGWRWAR
jgi:hypothetical protein